MIEGKLVTLEAVRRSSLARLRTWCNDPKTRKYFREYREISEQDQERHWERTWADRTQVWFEVRACNNLVGLCGLSKIHPVDRHAEASLFIAPPYRKKGYAFDGLTTLLNYGFKQLGLHKIYGEVYEFAAILSLDLKVGFRKCGLLKKHHFEDGKWWDSVLVEVLEEEWTAKDETS